MGVNVICSAPPWFELGAASIICATVVKHNGEKGKVLPVVGSGVMKTLCFYSVNLS